MLGDALAGIVLTYELMVPSSIQTYIGERGVQFGCLKCTYDALSCTAYSTPSYMNDTVWIDGNSVEWVPGGYGGGLKALNAMSRKPKHLWDSLLSWALCPLLS